MTADDDISAENTDANKKKIDKLSANSNDLKRKVSCLQKDNEKLKNKLQRLSNDYEDVKRKAKEYEDLNKKLQNKIINKFEDQMSKFTFFNNRNSCRQM